jgi:hypothetical protein
MASLRSALQALEELPGPHDLTIDKISLYSCLISCLRNDILLAQPAVEVTSPPEVLPLSIVEFLGVALHISDVQASWDIMKDHLWICNETAIGDEEFAIFKQFGWERGLSE